MLDINHDAYFLKPKVEHFSDVTHSQKTIDNRFVKEKAFHYMSQLDGWCPEQKAGYLIDHILKSKPEVIVEIGVFGGKSLVPMAYALKVNRKGQIFGIDPWSVQNSVAGVKDPASANWWANIDHTEIMNRLIKKIEEFSLQNQVTLIQASSEATPLINSIDLLHIDGNHSAEASWFDVTKWTPAVNPGGWIVLDDVSWIEEGSYTQKDSIAYLDACCKRILFIDGQNSWGVWKKL